MVCKVIYQLLGRSLWSTHAHYTYGCKYWEHFIDFVRLLAWTEHSQIMMYTPRIYVVDLP